MFFCNKPCALILSETLAFYKSFTFLLTYLQLQTSQKWVYRPYVGYTSQILVSILCCQFLLLETNYSFLRINK